MIAIDGGDEPATLHRSLSESRHLALIPAPAADVRHNEETIIGYIVIGLLGGIIAKLIIPGKQPGGIIVTMLLGIVGALLGGFLGGLIFHVTYSTIWSWSGLITSIIGALIVLLIYALIRGRTARRTA